MGHHRNTLLYSYEGRNKAFNNDHTNNINLVNPEEKFVCHAQVIMTRRNQGGKLVLNISIISTDYDSNIIGRHRNTLLPDEGSNMVSKPYLNTASKTDIDITQYDKYLLNELLNPNINSPSSNFSCKDYGTLTTLTKDRKETQPG